MPVFTGIATGLTALGLATTPAMVAAGMGTVAGLVSTADTARKSRHSGEQQTANTLAAQKEMTDKTIAAEAELNKPMPQVNDAKRKQAATRLTAEKYAGRGRQSTVMSDVLG